MQATIKEVEAAVESMSAAVDIKASAKCRNAANGKDPKQMDT